MEKLTKKMIETFEYYGKPACYRNGVGSGGQKVQCYKLEGCYRLDGHDEVLVEYTSARTCMAYALLPAGMWNMFAVHHPVPVFGVGEDYYHDAHEKSVRILHNRYGYDDEDYDMRDLDQWYQTGDSGRLTCVSATSLF